MTPIEIRNEKLAGKVMKNLTRRHFDSYYCATAKQAVEQVKRLIPEGSSVTWGGSMTLGEMGITQELKHDGRWKVLDRADAKGADETRRHYLKAFDCDYFLCSANAMTEDGVLVNIDGNGNRVAAITYGPRHVIFVVGLNKVCQNVEAALSRARGTAAPLNTSRLNLDTPCCKDGVCHNCNAEHCICNYVHFMRNSYPAGRHTVVLVGEPLGY